jgi:hypothetical protein
MRSKVYKALFLTFDAAIRRSKFDLLKKMTFNLVHDDESPIWVEELVDQTGRLIPGILLKFYKHDVLGFISNTILINIKKRKW